ncbi:MAG: hypothetical protein AMXMBFR67_09320 [Nitrospira sp.]
MRTENGPPDSTKMPAFLIVERSAEVSAAFVPVVGTQDILVAITTRTATAHFDPTVITLDLAL